MKKWLLADLHIHTTFSDGALPLEDVVKLYGESGFDVIAVTDHLFGKEVVTFHEQKIIAQSEPNSGSNFSILLPLRKIS